MRQIKNSQTLQLIKSFDLLDKVVIQNEDIKFFQTV